MGYPASEKLEIIRTVEGSHLPVKQTLDMLCIADIGSSAAKWCFVRSSSIQSSKMLLGELNGSFRKAAMQQTA